MAPADKAESITTGRDNCGKVHVSRDMPACGCRTSLKQPRAECKSRSFLHDATPTSFIDTGQLQASLILEVLVGDIQRLPRATNLN